MLLALEFGPHERFSAATAAQALYENGFLVAHSAARNFLRFDPCLTIAREEVDRLLKCLDGILDTAEHADSG
jgi:acetylornithine/succinyldiaminopimelate/putrescine aminotransferase